VSFYPQDRIIGRPRNPYAPVARKNKSTNILPTPGSSTPAESGQRRHNPHRRGLQCLCVIFILELVAIGQALSEHHPHQPSRWVLRDPARSDRVIKENITTGAPTFTVTVGDLIPMVGGPHSRSLRGTYWCPSSNPGKSYCNSPHYLFCGYWGCETIVTSDRREPTKNDEFLQVTWGPNSCNRPKFASDGMVYDRDKGTCAHLILKILNPTNAGWAMGKLWSVFIHKAGTDIGALVQIIKLVPQAPQAIGPNPVLHPKIPDPKIPTPLPHSIVNSTEVIAHTIKIPNRNYLWKMMQASYQLLNKTNPNLTEHCWLCY
ncbi:Retrovirus-related Env polyprotein from Fv-4 locus, partial [Eudyptes chrysolophus]